MTSLKDELGRTKFNQDTGKYEWFEEPTLNPRFHNVVRSKRKNPPTGARKIFRRNVWDDLWEGFHDDIMRLLEGFPPIAKARASSILFNYTYFTFVIEPVATSLGKEVNILMSAKDINALFANAAERKDFNEKLLQRVSEIESNPDAFADDIGAYMRQQLNIMTNQPQPIE